MYPVYTGYHDVWLFGEENARGRPLAVEFGESNGEYMCEEWCTLEAHTSFDWIRVDDLLNIENLAAGEKQVGGFTPFVMCQHTRRFFFQ